jgi:hypothetical protein
MAGNIRPGTLFCKEKIHALSGSHCRGMLWQNDSVKAGKLQNEEGG